MSRKNCRRSKPWCGAAWLAVIWAGPVWGAATVYVDVSATGLEDGTSWSDAYTDLQDALDAPVPDTEVWVAEGEYVPSALSGTDARTAVFALDNDVELYGGFPAGGGDGTFSARNPARTRGRSCLNPPARVGTMTARGPKK